jgi:hypothetical protein
VRAWLDQSINHSPAIDDDVVCSSRMSMDDSDDMMDMYDAGTESDDDRTLGTLASWPLGDSYDALVSPTLWLRD